MFSQNTQSWQQPATEALRPLLLLYMDPIKSNLPLALVINRWLLVLHSMPVRRRAAGRIFFPQRSLRPDVDCCILGGKEAPRCSWGEIYVSGSRRNADSLGNQKKSFCSASAPDKLTRSWPHYCHNTLGRGWHCLISKSTEIVWDFVWIYFLGGGGLKLVAEVHRFSP